MASREGTTINPINEPSSKIVFMGTPSFATASLQALVDEGFDVACVVTQPDKPSGRGRKLSEPPVKTLALECGIPVLQPASIRGEDFLDELKKLQPTVIVIVAYGKILPAGVLSAAPLGCINVHASLLPKLRGAAPANWAIINGDEKSGVTTMLLDEGMDTGPMLLKSETQIGPAETAGDLVERLSLMGAELLIETLTGLADNLISPTDQDESLATYAPILKKTDGCIDWKKEAKAIDALIRGVSPWPGAYTTIRGLRLKVHRARVSLETGEQRGPGSLFTGPDKGLFATCGRGSTLEILELQLEGKKRVSAEDFLKGFQLKEDERFD